MNILISGSSGFVGSNFVTKSKDYNFIKIDLRKTTLDNINFNGVDTVLHLAALAHQLKPAPANEYYKINRDLTYNFAKIAKENGVKHFVFMSSAKVFGETTNIPWNENSVCNPQDDYAKSKLEAENLILNLQDNSFTVAIVRPPLIYGAEIKANMLNLVKLVDKFAILPLGGISNKRHMVYIGNLVALLNNIINTTASGIFIACDARPISTSGLIHLISLALNKKVTLLQMPNILNQLLLTFKPPLSDRLFGSFLLDNSITKEKLNFIPPYSVEYGINEMIQWYKQTKNP